MNFSLLIIYLITTSLSLLAFSGIKWDEIIKTEKMGLAILVYILVSLAVGYCVGNLIIIFRDVIWSNFA